MGQLEDLQKQVEQLQGRLAKLEGDGTTYIAVIQDKSSSMAGREAATISGFNEYVSDLQSKAKKDDVTYKVTLTQFDTTVTPVYQNLDLQKVEPLNNSTYRVGGATALFDAMGDAITATREGMGKNDKALVLVMTDGEENSSRRFKRLQIIDMIKELEGTDNWTFVYLGADQDAWAAGTNLGFSGTNTYSYANNAAGIKGTFNSLAGATHAHRVTTGSSSSATFVQDYMPTTTTAPQADTSQLWFPEKDDQEDEDSDA